MTAEDRSQPAPLYPERNLPVVTATRATRSSIATSGGSCMIVVETVDKGGERAEVGLEFPTAALGQLLSVVHSLRQQAARRAMPAGQSLRTNPASCEVGSSSEMRGWTLLHLDGGLESEQLLCFPDPTAWRIAELVRKSILERLSPADRAKLLAQGDEMNGIQLPTRRLILPGGG